MGERVRTGIDTSVNNGKIDWPKVAGYFAFVKVSEGVGYIDPHAERDAWAIRGRGLKLGAYHFATLGNATDKGPDADARDEARWFAGKLMWIAKLDYPPVLDFEDQPAKPCKMSAAQCLTWINAFRDEMRKAGHPEIMLYGNPDFLNRHLPINHALGNVPLWIAHYGVESPTLPNGWDRYAMWQQTDKKIVTGISGKCDFNVMADWFRPPPTLDPDRVVALARANQ